MIQGPPPTTYLGQQNVPEMDACLFVCVGLVGWLLVLDSSRKTNMFFRSVTQRTPAPAAVVDCRAPCFEFFIIEYHK